MSSYATGSDETLVNSYTTNDQIAPTMTAMADGGWLVTWYGIGTGDTDYGIFQQRYAANGNAVGSETLVNSDTTGAQGYPVTSALADGGWVVSWYGNGPGDSDYGIFQRRYAADGHAIGSETMVNTYTTNDQYDPTTTGLADGGWVVSWFGVGAGGTEGIFQQHYGANGHAIGSETQVNTYTTDTNENPTVAALADGGWMVVWESNGAGDDYGVFEQRYAANGDTVGTQTLVNTYTTGGQGAAAITNLADGGWVVSWHGEGTGDGLGIFEQRYAANGATVGSETRVNSYTTGTQQSPAITALGDGGWVVTWEGEGTGDTDGIFQQRYAANGDAVGSNTLVNSYTTSTQHHVTITTLSDGGWVVAWGGEGAGDNVGAYQKHFAPDIDGSSHADKLTGTVWGEYLIGDGGNDKLDGKSGNDVLVGGLGNDTYIVNSSGDQVEELMAQGTDTVLASISYTLTGSVENLVLTGNAGLDATGNALANRLTGNSGNNILKGVGGADILTGAKGADKLYGGAGADHFVFLAGDGTDTIKDFDAKGADHDTVDLSHVSGLSDFTDLKAHHMTPHGGDVIIDTGHGDTITLDGVTIKDLVAADFLF